MLEDPVVVAVVVEDATIRAGGAGRDDQVGRRDAVVTAFRKLTLRTLGRAFDIPVDQESRELFETTHVQAMLPSRLRGKAGLQQERQADPQPPRSDPIEDSLLPVLWNQVPDQPRPGGMVQ